VTDATGQVPSGEGLRYQDPVGFSARLREPRPAAPARAPGYGRAWIITRYEDARAALADPRLAKDVHRWPGCGRSRPSEEAGLHKHMLNSDPPDHTRLRRLVQKEFTPRRAARLRPRAEAIAAGLLEEMASAPGGVIDLVSRYAFPLPVTVICELLGIPPADRERISALAAGYGEDGQSQRVTSELAAYFSGLAAARRAGPGDDLLSALIGARDSDGADGAGDALSGTGLLSTAFLLLMAGFETTMNLIASGAVALLTHPAELARLRGDRSLLPAAMEELLRFTSPVNRATDRFTTGDLPIGGVVIPAGEWVLVSASSANWDTARFPVPGRLDLGRDASGHVAFGYGIHYCLGAALARMEAEVALGALLSRFPGISLAVPPGEIRWRSPGLMNGPESLPVRLA
jgi:cytochrome P450